MDEVLDNVDARTRNFLLKSSLLRSMNDALIVRVTGEENGQMQLEEIERQGLFLQRMDDSGEWFRYHPLFGSFLRKGSPARPFIMRLPLAMPKCCAISYSTTPGACLTIAN